MRTKIVLFVWNRRDERRRENPPQNRFQCSHYIGLQWRKNINTSFPLDNPRLINTFWNNHCRIHSDAENVLKGIVNLETSTNRPARMPNWDLLRSLSMLAVLVVHSWMYLDPILGINVGGMLSRLAILCDPIFFTLSGYFAIRPLKTSLAEYYQKKFISIVLPLFVYGLVLYLYTSNLGEISASGFCHFLLAQLSPWWFIPALIPCLIIAPFLYNIFERATDQTLLMLSRIILCLNFWGIFCSGMIFLAQSSGHSEVAALFGIARLIFPVSLIPNSYFIYFVLGYFLRRLIPTLSRRSKGILVVLGAISWILDLLYHQVGIELFDPSYHWLFATISVFILFDNIQSLNEATSKVVNWTAKRSYSIYLLNYTAIAIVFPWFKDQLFGSALAEGLFAPARLAIWVGSLLLSYILALCLASIIDNTLLLWFKRIVLRAMSSISIFVAGHHVQSTD